MSFTKIAPDTYAASIPETDTVAVLRRLPEYQASFIVNIVSADGAEFEGPQFTGNIRDAMDYADRLLSKLAS